MAQETSLQHISLTIQFPNLPTILFDGSRKPFVETPGLAPPLELKLVKSDLGMKGIDAIQDGEKVIVEAELPGTLGNGLYRATIGGRPYVIKRRRNFRHIEVLRIEAQKYRTELRHLQGKFVPSFYGEFEGWDDGIPECCLILEDCGDNKMLKILDERRSWDSVDKSIKRQVLETIGEVHRAGLNYNADFIPTFLSKGNLCMVVGFSNAKSHECGWRGDLFFDDTYPKEDEFGCGNLYAVCHNVGCWRTHKYQRRVLGLNRKVPENFPSQEIVDSLFPRDYTVYWNGPGDVVDDYEKIFLSWLGKMPPDMSAKEFVAQNPIPPWKINNFENAESQTT